MAGDRAWQDTQGIWAGANQRGDHPARGRANPWQTTTAPAACLILAHNNWINIKTDADGGLDDFSSYHTAGVNLLLSLTARCIFIHSNHRRRLERRAFWALGTRDGGEVIVGLSY